MNENPLSNDTMQKVDELVKRVARKAGYNDYENMTYKEHLQAKIDQKRDKLARKYQKYRNKLSMKPSNTDFAEEIKTYLRDGLIDLMKEGYPEEEALKITKDKFDEAELSDTFDDFMREFNGFGQEEYMMTQKWYMENGEAVGLFYAAFLFLGLTFGGFLGYLFGGHKLINAGIGLAFGGCIGLSLGLLSNALLVIFIKRK